jgi:hypothetical protein
MHFLPEKSTFHKRRIEYKAETVYKNVHMNQNTNRMPGNIKSGMILIRKE